MKEKDIRYIRQQFPVLVELVNRKRQLPNCNPSLSSYENLQRLGRINEIGMKIESIIRDILPRFGRGEVLTVNVNGDNFRVWAEDYNRRLRYRNESLAYREAQKEEPNLPF